MFQKGKNPPDHMVILAPRLIGLECRVISFVFNIKKKSWTEVSLFRWTASYAQRSHWPSRRSRGAAWVTQHRFAPFTRLNNSYFGSHYQPHVPMVDSTTRGGEIVTNSRLRLANGGSCFVGVAPILLRNSQRNPKSPPIPSPELSHKLFY